MKRKLGKKGKDKKAERERQSNENENGESMEGFAYLNTL